MSQSILHCLCSKSSRAQRLYLSAFRNLRVHVNLSIIYPLGVKSTQQWAVWGPHREDGVGRTSTPTTWRPVFSFFDTGDRDNQSNSGEVWWLNCELGRDMRMWFALPQSNQPSWLVNKLLLVSPLTQGSQTKGPRHLLLWVPLLTTSASERLLLQVDQSCHFHPHVCLASPGLSRF